MLVRNDCTKLFFLSTLYEGKYFYLMEYTHTHNKRISLLGYIVVVVEHKRKVMAGIVNMWV